MTIFTFTGRVELVMLNENPSLPSRVKEVNFALDVAKPLKENIYIKPDGGVTAEGSKFLALAFIQGLVSSTYYASQEGYVNFRTQIEWIHNEMLRVAEHLEKEGNVKSIPGVFSDRSVDNKPVNKRPQRSTAIDLVNDLRERNTEGQYDRLIQNAANNWYHDFKQPDSLPGDPKAMLVDDLSRFTELADLRQKVIDGYYDESPDDADRGRMADDILGGIQKN